MFSKHIKSFFGDGIRNLLVIIMMMGTGAAIYGIKFDAGTLILGTIILLISLVALTGYYGILIDYNHQRYKIFLSFLEIKIGRWKPLPLIEKIILMPQNRLIGSVSLQTKLDDELYVIKLIPADKGMTIVVSKGLYDDLILEAEALAKELGVPVNEGIL